MTARKRSENPPKPTAPEAREEILSLRDDLARTHADLGLQVVQLQKTTEQADRELKEMLQAQGQRLQEFLMEREAAAAREREAAVQERAADKEMQAQALEGLRQALAAVEARLLERAGAGEARLVAVEAAVQEAREAMRREFSKMIRDFGEADRSLVERALLVLERRSAEQLDKFLKSLDARDEQLRSELRDGLASLRREVEQALSPYMKRQEFESATQQFASRAEAEAKYRESAARLGTLEKDVDRMQSGFEEGVKQVLARHLRVLEAELRTFVKELDRDRLDDVAERLRRLEERVGAIEGPRSPRSPAQAKLESLAARKVATRAAAEAVEPMREEMRQLRQKVEALLKALEGRGPP